MRSLSQEAHPSRCRVPGWRRSAEDAWPGAVCLPAPERRRGAVPLAVLPGWSRSSEQYDAGRDVWPPCLAGRAEGMRSRRGSGQGAARWRGALRRRLVGLLRHRPAGCHAVIWRYCPYPACGYGTSVIERGRLRA